MKKTLAMILAFVLVLALGIGATLAWLTDSTEDVKNTFTVGNIDISLEETADDFKMVPGEDITKDPVVTVEADSEACYLFIEVTESDNLDSFISYTIATGWTALADHDGVYYRTVASDDEDQDFNVLKDDKVTVLSTVEKTDMDALTEATLPTLTFKAYAVQQSKVDSAADAWGILFPTT